MAGLAAMGMLLASPALADNWNVSDSNGLYRAVANARNGDTITFTSNITLTSNLTYLSKNVTINGGNYTLSGAGQYRGLSVEPNPNIQPGPISVAINNLTIADTKAVGGKGGDSYAGNSNGGLGGGGGGGGAALGGGLYVGPGANVTVSNVSFSSNNSTGGEGGSIYSALGSYGGGGGGGSTGDGSNGRALGYGGPG
ncbi:pectate lyase-like adhesive domain-containing protein, partial [Mesorhizobium sp. BR1-1-16]|uniref:pectate lyase-like adhesive domain-containing protein n=1 Tax=Mesorhizobium sp. BR1-1-16 TaxID=2876653 RepID=UPI00336AA25E